MTHPNSPDQQHPHRASAAVYVRTASRCTRAQRKWRSCEKLILHHMLPGLASQPPPCKQAEKEAGNPVAGLVHSLQLDSNHITLLLANHLDTDEYEEAEPLKVRSC